MSANLDQIPDRAAVGGPRAGRRRLERVLIKHGTVVSMDEHIGTVSDCDVLIVDGEIAEVGSELSAVDALVIDAHGTVVAPGFVDTHRHLWETVIRGTLPACSLGEYFATVMGDYAPAFRAADVYAGNLVGAYEAINAGVTTVVDWCQCVNTPEHADAAVAALRETGIRCMYAYGWPGGLEWLLDSERSHPEDARRVRAQHFPGDDGLLTFALALRGPATLAMDVNHRDFALARDLDARVTVHVGMRVAGRPVREVELLRRADLLGPKTTYVHCNQTPTEDLHAIAASGGTVSVSPHVELVMGHGPPATGRLLASGLRPTLSVDVTTSAPGDMFTQMRTALAYERSLAFPEDPEDPEDEFAPKLTAEEVLRFATIDGARACGLAGSTGSLTPGKRGDVVLVRVDQINTMPVADPIAALVTCADVSNVDTVLVDGEIRKRDGRLLGADLPRLGSLIGVARDAVLRHTDGEKHGEPLSERAVAR